MSSALPQRSPERTVYHEPTGMRLFYYYFWICGCDSCQDICPYNRQHDWNQGDAYPGLEELAPQLQPEKLLAQSDTFIQEKVIPYTDYHIAADEAKTLKRCAARSLGNRT